MKFHPESSSRQAFTLVEMMVVTAIFTLLVLGTVSTQVFGMRMYSISEGKLLSTGDARAALNKVSDEIRGGKILAVGTGDSSSFTPVADYTAHTGNALQICATTDTNSFVRYFWDAGSSSLKRVVSGSGQVQTLAANITNQVVFQAEDFQGNVLSNFADIRIIRMTLDFYKPRYVMGQAGSDFYCLQTRITRRAIE